MAAPNPQRDPAADPSAIGADDLSPSVPERATTDLGGEPYGEPPRSKNIREENALKKIQSEYDRLKNLVGGLTKSRWLQELGPDGIEKALHQFEAMLTDPAAQGVARRLAPNPDGRTWGLTPAQRAAAAVDADMPGNGNADEYVEPWEKALNERLAPFEKRISEAIERLGTLSQSNAQEQVARHTRQFLNEYPLSEEERSEFSEAIGRRIASLDPQVVVKMGYEQFADFIGIPAIRKNLGTVFERKRTQKRSHLTSLATDASGVTSLGAETRPDAPVRPKSIAALNRELAEAAERAAREG